MIPKIIHFCWFGGSELPKSVKENIKTWEKECPDFKIKCWNEHNYNVYKNEFTTQAFKSKNYAFLTDYVRLEVIYKEGGVYLDTDVKLIKSLNEMVNQRAFMAFEQVGRVNTGIGFGSEPNSLFIKKNMQYYEKGIFVDNKGHFRSEICVKITTKLLIKYGLKYKLNKKQKVLEFTVYPTEYFSPIKMGTNKIHITKKTVGIHQYYASWYTGSNIKKYIKYRLIPLKQFIKYKILKRALYE